MLIGLIDLIVRLFFFIHNIIIASCLSHTQFVVQSMRLRSLENGEIDTAPSSRGDMIEWWTMRGDRKKDGTMYESKQKKQAGKKQLVD